MYTPNFPVIETLGNHMTSQVQIAVEGGKNKGRQYHNGYILRVIMHMAQQTLLVSLVVFKKNVFN